MARPRTDAIPEPEKLLTGPEVAALFRVDPKTVSRWAREERLKSVRTPGGHLRFNAAEVRARVEQTGPVR